MIGLVTAMIVFSIVLGAALIILALGHMVLMVLERVVGTIDRWWRKDSDK